MKLRKSRKSGVPAPQAPSGGIPALVDHKQFMALRLGAAKSLAELHRPDIEADGLQYNGVESWVAWAHNESRETQRKLIDSVERLLPKQTETTITHGVTAELLQEIRREKAIDAEIRVVEQIATDVDSEDEE